MKTFARMLFKACPRCHGDLTLDEYEHHDTGVVAYECLQCGRTIRIKTQFEAGDERLPLAA